MFGTNTEIEIFFELSRKSGMIGAQAGQELSEIINK